MYIYCHVCLIVSQDHYQCRVSTGDVTKQLTLSASVLMIVQRYVGLPYLISCVGTMVCDRDYFIGVKSKLWFFLQHLLLFNDVTKFYCSRACMCVSYPSAQDTRRHTYTYPRTRTRTQAQRKSKARRKYAQAGLPSHNWFLFLILLINMPLDSFGGACTRTDTRICKL